MNPFAISTNIDYSPSTIVELTGDDVKEETTICHVDRGPKAGAQSDGF